MISDVPGTAANNWLEVGVLAFAALAALGGAVGFYDLWRHGDEPAYREQNPPEWRGNGSPLAMCIVFTVVFVLFAFMCIVTLIAPE